MTDKNTTTQMATISLKAARLSMAEVIAYQVLLVALIFIRPDLDPLWHSISEWVIGRFGFTAYLTVFVMPLGAGAYGPASLLVGHLASCL